MPESLMESCTCDDFSLSPLVWGRMACSNEGLATTFLVVEPIEAERDELLEGRMERSAAADGVDTADSGAGDATATTF